MKQAPLSLLSTLQDQSFALIFVHSHQTLLSVSIPIKNLTVADAILLAISKFNSHHHCDFPTDLTLFNLYAARKSGKKNTDLPALEKEQLLSQTTFKNFYLHLTYEQLTLHSKKSSDKSIETEISMHPNKKSQSRVNEDNFFGCFCRGSK